MKVDFKDKTIELEKDESITIEDLMVFIKEHSLEDFRLVQTTKSDNSCFYWYAYRQPCYDWTVNTPYITYTSTNSTSEWDI